VDLQKERQGLAARPTPVDTSTTRVEIQLGDQLDDARGADGVGDGPEMAGFEMSRFGAPKLGWLRALNASTRNSRLGAEPSVKTLDSIRSRFQ
jgi:hypothetical protein